MYFSDKSTNANKQKVDIFSGQYLVDYKTFIIFERLHFESTPRGGGVNRCTANLMKNNAKLKS